MLKIIHCYPRFMRFGGAQKVIMTLFSFFRKEFPSYVSSFQKYDDIISLFKKNVSKEEYFELSVKNVRKLGNSVVFSHHRKITSFLVLVSILFRFRLVHVSHSVFTDKKFFSLFPKNIIAVSEAARNNLIVYFGVSRDRIKVIYNGIEDFGKDVKAIDYVENGKVKILFLGQIEPVKQQIDTIEFLKDKLKSNVTIDFAGDGKDAFLLQELISKEGLQDRFNYLGFISNVNELIQQYHYIMLFSKKEGLGLSLIEACMLSKPVITRGIDGCEACAEICTDKYNGFIVNNYEELERVLNTIDLVPANIYQDMCDNARKIYEDKFSLNIMEESYRSYISTL